MFAPKGPESMVLQRALDGWRSVEADRGREQLSDGARANVLALSRQSNAPKRPALSALFVPFRRIVAATAVPALALSLSFAWLIGSGGPELTQKIASLQVEASKIDGEAVFSIANGGRTHRVYRSSSTGEIGREDLYATTTETFRDSLSDRARVVFYRID